ncbi:hypothetical protein EDC04DRAFT_2597920 [Pisolithus marmoratus]|nr:hypothetical protein EDC04DRAFT_2597920 [Pisolithus marmoratus]
MTASSPGRDVDALFVALDANFCLRHHAVSSNENDLSLSQGWAYFMEDRAFKAYLNDHKNNVQEKSTCLNHNMVNMAEVKSKKGCDATGVGMVWHKKLLQQLDKMPPSLQLNLCHQDLTFLVPKFHLPAHITSCQWTFSFDWIKGIGRTDGEEPEHGWANLNLAAGCTKDTGPGHHCDMLDDYFGDWNWKKLFP